MAVHISNLGARLQLGGSTDLWKDVEVDPRDVAGLEELISRMEPLWVALSNAIAVLEADLKAQPSAPADAANANRVLPPGANQVSNPRGLESCWFSMSCTDEIEGRKALR